MFVLGWPPYTLLADALRLSPAALSEPFSKLNFLFILSLIWFELPKVAFALIKHLGSWYSDLLCVYVCFKAVSAFVPVAWSVLVMAA